MKKVLQKINFLMAALLLSSFIYGQGIPTRDTLIMGPGYTQDIFYSFKDGEVSNIARDTWDIAFFTPRYSAGIIINEGNYVELYTYPNGDASAWNSIDTTNMSEWKMMYNSAEQWEEGAFNANATGHPDYGWGWYNQIDHHIYGDSLYIIKTSSGVKKLFLEEKKSLDNIYLFTYADIDGSNEQMVELDVKPYETKMFAYYSLSSNEVLDREPEKENWDVLFTRYNEMIPDGEGGFIPYSVVGATNNIYSYSSNVYPVNVNYNDWTAQPFDSTKNAIGRDWKFYDFGLNEWTIKDSNYYFVKNYEGDIYKLQFNKWEGTSTGMFIIYKWLLSLSSTDEFADDVAKLSIYPNPASDQFSIQYSSLKAENCQLIIIDQSGRLVYRKDHAASELKNGLKLDQLNLSGGLYLLSVTSGDESVSQKLIIR